MLLYYHRGRTRLNALQPMVIPKRFDIPPPDWGMLRRSCMANNVIVRYNVGLLPEIILLTQYVTTIIIITTYSIMYYIVGVWFICCMF